MFRTKTCIALGSLLLSLTALAADHRDSPIATNDPAADINDVYTFVNPNDARELIVAVTAVPLATARSQFSDVVDYRIHLDNGSGEQLITCTFPGSTRINCVGPGALSASGSVGAHIRGNGGLRVYAGLRDDPFFFDLDAFNATRAAVAPRFRNPGVNFFKDAGTLAIVLGIPNSAINGGGQRNVVKVYASTKRQGGDGIGPGISGSWYDASKPGHGFFLEVVRGGDGRDRLNALWATYDNFGSQLYVLGVGEISGNTATIQANSTRGGGLPPNFSSSNVQLVPFGTLTFTFSDCSNGTVSYQTSISGFTASATLPINRLTAISGSTCALLSKGQIDRMGRPGINTALVNLIPSTGTALKDAYNRAEAQSAWTQFIPEMQANLSALDTLDGVTGNVVLPPATLAPVLNDDRLIVDVSKPACNEYLAVELGVAGKCGGRTLQRDVIDDTLGAIVGPGVSDNVADDNAYLADFPFLGDPR